MYKLIFLKDHRSLPPPTLFLHFLISCFLFAIKCVYLFTHSHKIQVQEKKKALSVEAKNHIPCKPGHIKWRAGHIKLENFCQLPISIKLVPEDPGCSTYVDTRDDTLLFEV